MGVKYSHALVILHMTKDHTPHFLGHRSRLREKFLNAPGSLKDYEVLELLLFAAIPRRDTKPIAKRMLASLGSLSGVVHSSLDRLLSIEGVTPSVTANLLLVREILGRILRQEVQNKHVLSSWNELLEYLKVTMRDLQSEQFRVVFLNKKNLIIADEVQSEGTIDQTSLYPREVVKRALFHGATAIILVHNHPSGDPRPSQADIELTKEVVKACETFNILVHDHVVVGKQSCFSFKGAYLL
jgi:DNA repair protein RadC